MQRLAISSGKMCSRALHQLPGQQQCLSQELYQFSFQGRVKDALYALHHAEPGSIQVTCDAYLRLIRSCIKLKAFQEGHEIHKHMVKTGLLPDVVLSNHIIIMYSKTGELKLACEVFDKMNEKNLYSWTAIIDACVKGGDYVQAVSFYVKMIRTGVRADCFLYPLILKSCGKMRDLEGGRRFHADVSKSGFACDVVVLNSLLDMYSKCESLIDAEKVFLEMDFWDSITWTTLLVGYVQAGYFLDALRFFKKMLNMEVRPCSAALAGVLPIFSVWGSLNLAKQIHGLIVGCGFQSDKYVGSGLVDMYANCGSLGYGQLAFERVKEGDAVCWNAMVKGYSIMGHFDEALKLLAEMHEDGLIPNKSTWSCLMSAFLQKGPMVDLIKRLEHAGVRLSSVSLSTLFDIHETADGVEHVKELQRYLSKGGYLSDSIMASHFIDFYSKFGDLETARAVFDEIEGKELAIWNCMISCYANNGSANKALVLFDSMRKVGVEPDIMSWNSVIEGFVKYDDFEAAMGTLEEMQWSNQRADSTSFNIIIPVLASLKCLEKGKELHNLLLRNGCEMNQFVNSALINMYSNCSRTNYAFRIFNSMNSKDIISWNTLISGFAKNGLLDEALKTFSDMKKAGKHPNIVTWTSLISGFVQNGQVDEGFRYFRELQSEGLEPNPITIASILPACAQSATLCHGKAIYGYITRKINFSSDLFLTNALIDMFIKCGSLAYAEQVFRITCHKDTVSWNTMIMGYAVHGKSDACLSLFNQMFIEGILPDSVTFIGVLSACSHAGLIDDGWKHFNKMTSVYGIAPTGKHYACMVDLLSRGGHFEDAKNFIVHMPVQPSVSLWGALLSSARTHKNLEMAEYAARHLIELQPEDPGNYVILSNIYASEGRWKDVSEVRDMMIDSGVTKLPGCSWIEVKNQVFAFTVENMFHPDMERVINVLDDLLGATADEGYIPETQSYVGMMS